MVKLKRVYEEPSAQDGYRVLVDRLWPRGLTKGRSAVDLWLKEIGPSSEPRKWPSSSKMAKIPQSGTRSCFPTLAARSTRALLQSR
jgi:uncharacterized protein YeaO (DUF488 family)